MPTGATSRIEAMTSVPQQQWNPELYQSSHSCIWGYGRGLMQLLAPKRGERILDVGAGTGQLAHEIAASGAEVVGIDASAEMIAAARKNFPKLRFEVVDVAAIPFANEFDAVFSNAVLHWISDQESAIASISKALKPGGRFVFEMGGHGNLQLMLTAVYQALREFDIDDPDKLCPWTFPRIGEYAHLIESHGLQVRLAMLFDRPTPLESGREGLANWMKMFVGFALDRLAPEDRDQLIRRVEELARPNLFREGRWVADYKRLRMVAVKE